MTDINRLITSLKRRSDHAKEFVDSITFVKLEDLDALVEALEKAQQLATQQGNIACALFDEVTAQRQRIAELEESHAQVIQSRDHYKRMLEEGLEQLAESRTVTVKLASRRLPSDYADDEFGNEDLAAIHNACRLECKVSVEKYLSAYGIAVKWEAE
ncbi:hypothetical protein ACJLW1_003202 [Klebsiella aerogenes]